MTKVIRCSKCRKIFSNASDYQNHSCGRTLGGSGDLRHNKQGGTGGGLDHYEGSDG